MLFEESGVGARVVVRRGYRTITTKAELERLGFGRSQRNVPALLIPVCGPTGEVVLYQSRPDSPRIDRRGRPVKYETPTGAGMALDVHPFCRESLADPGVPLVVTEGIKKGDALVSRGLSAVALIGVWNWRGTNEHGGKTALAEWEFVALNGRKVYIVFDSDVIEKREVHAALCRLKVFLEHRGARVRLIYLPAGEGGVKQGVDDYLASGHAVSELLEHAIPELKRPPDDDVGVLLPYRAASTGLVWDRPTQNGTVPTPLTNFTASITADVAEDDGAELRRHFEIGADLNGRRVVFSVPSGQFAGMGWATEHLGAGAIVYPGFGIKEHARTAVQMLSGEIPARHVYSHTGWRKIGDGWLFLHGGGAIGQVGQVGDVHVELGGGLEGRTLPEPPEGEDLVEAILASLELWELAPHIVAVSLHAGTYRAALGDTDFSIHLSGPTGEGKSELAALCQQHYGPELDSRRLTSWESTENAIEGQAFQAKDQLMVLDDFAPTGSSYDVQRWHKKADRVLRAKGNASGRQRMRSDTTLRPEKPPRALIHSTGEDVHRGQSLRARMLVLELSPGDLDWRKLARCQWDAASGLHARAMSGFLRWLAARYDDVRASLREEREALREWAALSAQHKRTPGIVADLGLGLRYFLLFAHDAGALSAEEAERLWLRGWAALGEAAAAQGQHQAAGEPTRRFCELLSAAVVSGRAHVADPEGDEPEEPGAWGWRRAKVGTGDYERAEWRPLGERVGWVEGDDLYLLPEAAYAAAQKKGRESGEPLTVNERTLRKRLHERGLLLSVEGSRPTLAVRRTLEGRRRGVLHLSADFLSLYTDLPDRPDHDEEAPFEYAAHVPSLWSGLHQQPDHETDQREPRRQTGNVSIGQVGQVSDGNSSYRSNGRVNSPARERFTI
jgi:hypothetical protein